MGAPRHWHDLPPAGPGPAPTGGPGGPAGHRRRAGKGPWILGIVSLGALAPACVAWARGCPWWWGWSIGLVNVVAILVLGGPVGDPPDWLTAVVLVTWLSTLGAAIVGPQNADRRD